MADSRDNEAVVAVDVGTSAVRAALVTAAGTVARITRIERMVAGGGEYFDPETLLAEVRTALRSLARSGSAWGGRSSARGVPRPAAPDDLGTADARGEPRLAAQSSPGIAFGARGELRPVALAVSAHIGAVAVDADLRAVGRGGGWSDPRGIDEVRALDENLRTRLLRAAGRPAVTGGGLALALALRRDPALARRVRHLLSPKDFLLARLTGEVVTDIVSAAYTLLAEVASGRWQDPAVAELGLDPSWLPRQAAPTEIVGRLTQEAAEACALPPGLPVVAGGPDGSVGIGLLLRAADGTGPIADVAGTTDVLGRMIADPGRAPAGAVVNPALMAGHWVAGGPTGMTGGAIARWRSLLQPSEKDEPNLIPPGANGLRVLPSLTGSRYPRWRPGDRGGVLGLRSGHTTAHLLRAAQEGAGYTVREGVDLLDPAGSGQRAPIVLAGGTARSAAAAQLRADVLHRTVLVGSEPDVTLLGAAALALRGAELADDFAEAVDRLGCEYRPVDPDPERAARYDQLFADWRRARDAAETG